MFQKTLDYINNFDEDFHDLTLQSTSMKLDVINFFCYDKIDVIEKPNKVLVISPNYKGGIEYLSKMFSDKNNYDYMRIEYDINSSYLLDHVKTNKYDTVINFYVEYDMLDFWIPLRKLGIRIETFICTPFYIYETLPILYLSNKIYVSNETTYTELNKIGIEIELIDYENIIEFNIFDKKEIINKTKKLRIGWIGRINNLEKRFSHFKELVEKIESNNHKLLKDIEFIVCGELEDNFYEDFLNNNSHINYTGFVSNPFLYEMDAIIVTSLYECQSMTILEAFKRGIDIIGYDLRMNYNNHLVNYKVRDKDGLYATTIEYCTNKLQ